MSEDQRVSLTSGWYLRPGCEDKVIKAIRSELVPRIMAEEEGTLTYFVHRTQTTDAALQPLPPTDAQLLLFYEEYASPAAFLAHVSGEIFADFVANYGDCFVQSGGKPFTTVTFLSRKAGFARSGAASAANDGAVVNRHPAVMFELLSPNALRSREFYSTVFGWNYEAVDESSFHYVHFPAGSPPLLGGIGSAKPDEPGFTAGTNFYLQVDDVAALETTLACAEANGGKRLMQPTPADGYCFAMFTDPDGFAIGLIAPFAR